MYKRIVLPLLPALPVLFDRPEKARELDKGVVSEACVL